MNVLNYQLIEAERKQKMKKNRQQNDPFSGVTNINEKNRVLEDNVNFEYVKSYKYNLYTCTNKRKVK